MAIRLSISSEEFSDEDVQEFTNDLCHTIMRETNIDAKIMESPPQKGAKGEPITLGLLALTFIGGKGVIALFNVIKSYFERVSSLTLELQREDGSKLKINAQNMKSEQIKATLNELEKFIEKSR
jgi:hypothetical protein